MWDQIHFYLYISVKLAAYWAWCYLGLRLLNAERSRPELWALLWGGFRLVLGLSLGIGIWFASTVVYSGLYTMGTQGTLQQALTYLAVYVPVRWFEWTLLAILMIPQERVTMTAIAVGGSGRARWWRLGGIVLSCLADIPMIIEVDGLPIGRFFC